MANNSVEVNKQQVPSAYVLVNMGQDTLIVNISEPTTHHGIFKTNSPAVHSVKEHIAKAMVNGKKNYAVEVTVPEGEACSLLIPTKADRDTPFAEALPTNNGYEHYPVYGACVRIDAFPQTIAGQERTVFGMSTGNSFSKPLTNGEVNMFCAHGEDMDAVADAISLLTGPSYLPDDPAQ